MRTVAPPQYLAPRLPDTSQAPCRDVDSEMFFPLRADDPAHEAKAICARCPDKVKTGCREYALDQPALAGVWGGMTEADRRTERRRRFEQRCPGCGRRGHGPCTDTHTCDEARNKRSADL